MPMSENGYTQNETPAEPEKMDISEIMDVVLPASDQSPVDVAGHAVRQASAVTYLTCSSHPLDNDRPTTSSTSRERLDSTFSLDGLDLELPTLDAYQEEYAEFPSSPKQLKAAGSLAMPLEASSLNTAGVGSDEEDDRSMYQAILSPDCRDVRLRKDRPGSLVANQRGGRRRIRVTAALLAREGGEGQGEGEAASSDESQDGSQADRELDEMLSAELDSPDEIEDSILERLGEAPEPIPELTAAEERSEARSWRPCSVGGVERRIDMKVIEPYKRVLSHGGYMSAGSRNAIIVFSACFLPDRSRVDYSYVMDNLFFYVLATLEQLVTEDYVLVYLHGATCRACMPPFSWLKRCYQMIDRRLRKNLKGLYLVHPTFWLKTIVLMTRPFISTKFSRKLSFVETLSELRSILPLEPASIPDRVRQLDDTLTNVDSHRKKKVPDYIC